MKDTPVEGIEIPDELLEHIAGGVLSDEIREVLDKALPPPRQKGTSKERALEIFSLAEDPRIRADTLAYIEEIWDTL